METGVSATGTFNIRPVGYASGTVTTTPTTITRARLVDHRRVRDRPDDRRHRRGERDVPGLERHGADAHRHADRRCACVWRADGADAVRVHDHPHVRDVGSGLRRRKTIDVTGDAGGTFTISSATTTTLTVAPIGLSTLPNQNGANLTVKLLNLGGSNSTGSFLTDGFAVGQELALGRRRKPPPRARSASA